MGGYPLPHDVTVSFQEINKMRGDPYPSRFYPRMMDEPELDGDELSAPLLPALDRDLRQMLSFLLATYLLFALLFALTTQANAAPTESDAGAPAALWVAGESCAGLESLALQ